MIVTESPKVLKATDIETGQQDNISSHHGLLGVSQYSDLIGMGLIDGHSEFQGKGRRDGLTTLATGEDTTNIASLPVSGLLPFPNQTTGEQLSLVSDNAADTAAGAGARTVKVHYIKADGTYNHETVLLNGTTPVDMIATDVRFVQQITVESLGTPWAGSLGNITIHQTGTPALIYARILPGTNMSMNSHRMIPLGLTFFLKAIRVSATSSKPISARVTATCDHAGIYSEGVFKFTEVVECQDFGIALNLPVPKRIPSLAIIKGQTVSIQAGGSVSISYEGWVE